MNPLLPLLIVALLVWAGIFAFLMRVDRQSRELERRLEATAGGGQRRRDLDGGESL
jgi:hypothetical protein